VTGTLNEMKNGKDVVAIEEKAARSDDRHPLRYR
jgi:hypothetical protein